MLDFQIKDMAGDEEDDGDEEPTGPTTGEVFGEEEPKNPEEDEEEY